MSENGSNGSDAGTPPLPRGWAWTTVGEAGEVKLGRQRSPQHHDGPNMRPYLRVANVYEDRLQLSDVLKMNFTPKEYDVFKLEPNDILLNEGQSLEWVGRPAMYRGELPGACFQNTLVRFRPGPSVRSSFALLVFRHYMHSGRFSKIAKWTTNIAHLGSGRFSELPFPLPPLREQTRITRKFDELSSKLDAGIATLKRVKVALKRYRASVLKAAVEGKLTAEWRAKHPNAEPASQLLRRIFDERRRRWEADQLAKFKAAGKEPPKNWREKYEEPVGPDTSTLPALPSGWCWTTMDALASVTGGITKGQKRSADERTLLTPYLRVANVQRGFLDLSEIKSIEATEDDVRDLRLEIGDILFIEGGDRDKLGRGWVWRGEIPNCIHQNHVFRARLFGSEVIPEFVSHHGNTFGRAWFMRTGKQSVNLASINMTVLKAFPVPLTLAAEQRQIIDEINARLSGIDAIERQVEADIRRAARLRQSILKRAFEGKLVPQNPNDESADRLLERVSKIGVTTQREGASNGKDSRKRAGT